MSEILENALDSLRMAVGHYRDQELETADKWAILEMFHAIELLLKERLHREHPLFIYKNIDQKIGDDSHTVGLREIMVRFTNLSVDIPAEYRNILVDLQQESPNPAGWSGRLTPHSAGAPFGVALLSTMTRPKKPTGLLGTLRVGSGRAEFRPVQFPASKVEIENLVLDSTIRAFAKQSRPVPWPATPVRNEEDHFDFTIPVVPPEYLDLMEIAFFPPGTAGFRDASMVQHQGQMVDAIWAQLTQKALHYGQPPRQPIHLLLYSTDFAFYLSPDLLSLLGYYLSICDRGLKSITYCVPTYDDSALAYLVHPRPLEDFKHLSVREIRSKIYRVADLSDPIIRGGWLVTFPFTSKRRPK